MAHKDYPEYLINGVAPRTSIPDPRRMGVTALCDSPLVRTLGIKYYDKVQEDPADKLWALYGTALDTIVKANNRLGMVDMKFEYQLDDFLLVGKPDIYYPSSGLLVDLKVTSVWNLQKPKKEWAFQLNVYRYLMAKLNPNFKVTSLEIHGIGRDWRQNEFLRYGGDYPSKPFVMIDIPMWDLDETGDIIREHARDHKMNPERECTDEEKWSKPDQYAVMKKGRKSALRVLDTNEEAYAWINSNGHTLGAGGITICKRKGENVRCNSYCAYNQFCPYYLKSKETEFELGDN